MLRALQKCEMGYEKGEAAKGIEEADGVEAGCTLSFGLPKPARIPLSLAGIAHTSCALQRPFHSRRLCLSGVAMRPADDPA
jgi:hypothetical protein